MQIAYWTMDDVNLDWAKQTAASRGATLTPMTAAGVEPETPFDAVLYDMDHTDPLHGRMVIAELLSHPAMIPVGLHGYSLSDEDVAALQAHGVVVSPLLTPQMVWTLCQAATPSHVFDAADAGDQTEQHEAMDDLASFCESVRALAARAHQLVRRAADSAGIASFEIDEILEWIGRIDARLHQYRRQHEQRFQELHSWVIQLRSRIESLPELTR